jgi:hypothetical protein
MTDNNVEKWDFDQHSSCIDHNKALSRIEIEIETKGSSCIIQIKRYTMFVPTVNRQMHNVQNTELLVLK